MTDNALRAILDGVELRTDHFDANDVFAAIATHARAIDESSIPDDLRAELLAFGCTEHHGRAGDRQFNFLEGNITETVIEYWEHRARQSSHPSLKWRYAALAIEARELRKQKAKDAEMQQIIIDAAVRMAQEQPDFQVATRLARAYTLAIRYGNTQGILLVRDALIGLEAAIAVDRLPGTWGFSYDVLLGASRQRLDPEIEHRIISDLEARFLRLLASIQALTDVHILTWAAVRLAAYHHRTTQSEQLAEVLNSYADGMLGLCASADPYLVIGQLTALAALCVKYGQRELEAKVILAKTENQKRLTPMPGITTTIEITDDQLQEHLDALLSDGLEVALQRLAWWYVPNLKQVEEDVARHQREAPLSAMVPITKLDQTGRDVAGVGSTEGDLSGRAVLVVEEGLLLRGFWLYSVLAKLRDENPNLADTIVDVIHGSPLFDPAQRGIIEKGVGAYSAGDHVTAIHLLVPQIEAAIRNCAAMIGLPTMRVKPDRTGTSLRLLDDLLRDAGVGRAIGDDAAFYFRVLLSDPRGWNVRHKVCHGFAPIRFLAWPVSTLIVHVLLVLAQIRETPEDRAQGEDRH